MRVAAIQMRCSADPQRNAQEAVRLVREAAAAGADYVQTPEITNLVQRRRSLAEPHVRTETDDPVLTAVRAVAAETGVTVHLGSIVVREMNGEDARWRNRSILVGADGAILARYDKIHMFDVDLPDGTSFRESATFAPGDCAVAADVAGTRLGFSICFDLRFPHLYETLAEAGAAILAVPAAFTEVTGRAHWHTLVRARAVENGAFVVAAAQEGEHEDGRVTYGHSLIVDPWGRILAEAEATPSIIIADLDLARVDEVRRQIPVLPARRAFAVTLAHAADDVPERRRAS